MLSLLAPGALLALTALAMPPLLHLRRRSEQKLMRFAALRWLGQGARPRSQVRLEQRLLLAVRLLLLTALVFLLAMPVWRSAASASRPWVVVTPGVDPAAARAVVEGSPTEWHWLAPAFPALDAAAPAPAGEDFASLLRQLDAELPPGAALQVVVPQELSGLDAERLQLHRAVEWHVVAGNTLAPSAIPAHTGNDLQLALRYDAQHTAGLALVRALAAAWRAAGLNVTVDEAQSDTAPAAGVDALFWLGAELPDPLRQWTRAGGTLIASDPAASGQAPGTSDTDAGLPAPITLGRGRLLLFSAPLDPVSNAALRNPELPTRLLTLLRHDTTPPDRAPAASVSPLRVTETTPNTAAATSLDTWLALLAALLFLAERILSLRAARQRT
jgi:hypothetical protein